MNDEPNGLHLNLVWPPSILNPNVKAHWGKKYRHKTALFDAWFYDTFNHGVKLDPEKRYKVDMIFCPPDKRVRDTDNLIAACKAGLDGMCKALGIDDSHIRTIPDWGPVVEHGKVEVVIVEEIGS